jgi:hypothetical protein
MGLFAMEMQPLWGCLSHLPICRGLMRLCEIELLLDEIFIFGRSPGYLSEYFYLIT